LAACAPQEEQREALPPLVWPAWPAEPRIEYVHAFSRPDDLGIRKGFFPRLVDLVFGASEARLVRPMAVVAAGRTLYVADPGAWGVHRFDLDNGDYRLIRAENDYALPSPVGLARGANGDVYVADSQLATIFVIRAGSKFAVPVRLHATLQQPTGIAYDASSGRLFVADTAGHRLNVFERDGSLAATIGRRGTQEGEFNFPTLIWLAAPDKLYVTDSLNFRVQIFDRAGRYLGKFGGTGDGAGDLPRQKGVATDSFGHVYIVDSLFHAVQVFSDSGRLLLSIGALGRQRGEFWLPTGIFIGEDNFVYVADSYNRRVQVFRYVGGAT
jgi:DNA-binding beta-propeller fold protein YncE